MLCRWGREGLRVQACARLALLVAAPRAFGSLANMVMCRLHRPGSPENSLLVTALGFLFLLAPNPAFSRGGSFEELARRSLDWHERHGGHTMARHVGRSDDQLRARLKKSPKIRAASTFPNQATAEGVIREALRANRVRVRRWLGQDGEGSRLVLRWDAGRVIGRGWFRGERRARELRRATIVLSMKRKGEPIVLTAYPN